jgi:hypothetical protein
MITETLIVRSINPKTIHFADHTGQDSICYLDVYRDGVRPAASSTEFKICARCKIAAAS